MGRVPDGGRFGVFSSEVVTRGSCGGGGGAAPRSEKHRAAASSPRSEKAPVDGRPAGAGAGAAAGSTKPARAKPPRRRRRSKAQAPARFLRSRRHPREAPLTAAFAARGAGFGKNRYGSASALTLSGTIN